MKHIKKIEFAYARYSIIGNQLNKEKGLLASLLLAALMQTFSLNYIQAMEAQEQFPCGENDPWGKLSYVVETPHTDWATNITGDAIRILAVGPGRSMREMAELHQRLKCEIIPVMSETEEIFATPPYDCSPFTMSVDERIAESLKRIKEKADVILIGMQSWKSMPAEMRYELLKKVNDEGVTLINFQPVNLSKEMEILLGRPAEKVDMESIVNGCLDENMRPLTPMKYDLQVRRFGTGRILTVMYHPKGSTNYGWYQCFTSRLGDDPRHEPGEDETRYDYKMALVAKLTLWAANRLGPSRLGSIGKEGERFNVSVSGAEQGGRIRARIRNVRGEVLKEYEPTATSLSVSLPENLSAGGHVFDTWLMDKEGKTLDFASLPFELTSVYSGATLTVNTPKVKAGEPFHLKLTLPKELSEKGVIEWRVTDPLGRILDKLVSSGSGKSFEQEMKLPPELAADIAVVEALIKPDQERTTRVAIFLPTPRILPKDEFYLMAWAADGPGNVFQHYSRFRNDRQNGVDALMGPYPPEKIIWYSWAGLKCFPYSTGVVPEEVTGNIRKPCLDDPVYWEMEKQKLGRLGGQIAAYSPFVYSFGDECRLGNDVCYCDRTQSAFRLSMSGKYNTIEAANKAWKTSFTSWDKVKGERLAEAKSRGSFGLYMDFRRFMDRNYCDAFLKLTDIIHTFDPGAPTGWEGIFGTLSDRAIDYPYLAPKLGFMGPYTMVNWRDPKEMIRYWGQKQRVGGGWFGDYARGNYGSLYDNIGSAKLYDSVTRFEPWNMLLHGYNSAMWFSMARPFVCHQPLPYYQSAKDEISEIKHGMSKLLLNADRLDDRIAVYYDLSCLWANEISGGQRYGKIVNDMMAVLEHCHLQYGMISAADLGDVTTLRKKYDLLILPSVRPLDDTQVKILREFIAQGGRIIADTMPGIMDEHGDIREKSPLTDLFSGTSCRIIEANWGRDGQEYTASLSREKRETMVNVMSLTLSDLGVNPPIKLEPNLQRVEVVRFALGDQEFVSLLPEIDAVDGESRECRLTLPHKGHVYDVRARKYMGELQEIPVTIRPARAMVFAILPSRPKEISVKTDIASARQGRIVSLEVAVRDADGKQRSRAIRAALVDPSGKDRPELSRNLFLPNGNLKTDLYLPLSEPSGEWSLRLQDVVSGLSREIKITVPSL